MLIRPWDIYLATRKKHDQLFNTYVMRPIAAVLVALLANTRATPNQVTLASLVLFITGAVMLATMTSFTGGLAAIAVLELSYLCDCADGMLARHKKIASKEGHLFDFFTDETKAALLVCGVTFRLHETSHALPEWLRFGKMLTEAPYLALGIISLFVVTAAISLTNFVRRPELSGKETPVEAHYETVTDDKPRSSVGMITHQVVTFLRFLGHYPSHIWLFALADRLDAFFFVYTAINGLYLALGWMKLFVRFGRF